MRTYVRVRRGERPPCGPRLVLRLGRAARRATPEGPARHRRQLGGAGRQLRGQGTRRPRRDGRIRGAAALPARGRRAAADVGVLRGEQGGVRDLRATLAGRSSRSRSTRRSSTRAGWRRCSGRPRRSRPGCGATCAARSACRSRSASRVTKFLAKVASAVAKPDGLLVVPPGGELAFLHPLPIERLWGVGPVTSRKLRAVGITTVRQVAEADEDDLVELLGRGCGPAHLRAGPQPRPAPRTSRAPAADDGLAARARPAHAQVARGHRRHRRRDRRPPRPAAARGQACLPHGHAAAALRRLTRARHARSRCRRRPRRPRRSSPPRASCSRPPMPMIERQGLTLVGHRARQPRRRQRRPARAAARGPPRDRARRDARQPARPLRPGHRHARRAARPACGPGGAAATRLRRSGPPRGAEDVRNRRHHRARRVREAARVLDLEARALDRREGVARPVTSARDAAATACVRSTNSSTALSGCEFACTCS